MGTRRSVRPAVRWLPPGIPAGEGTDPRGAVPEVRGGTDGMVRPEPGPELPPDGARPAAVRRAHARFSPGAQVGVAGARSLGVRGAAGAGAGRAAPGADR